MVRRQSLEVVWLEDSHWKWCGQTTATGGGVVRGGVVRRPPLEVV